MSRPFSVSIPHELGQAEAERRIRAGVVNFKSSFGSMARVGREHWRDGVLDFDLTAMGQQCQGKVTVLERSVQMELTLSGMLAMVAGKIRDAVSRKGRVLLENSRPRE